MSKYRQKTLNNIDKPLMENEQRNATRQLPNIL